MPQEAEFLLRGKFMYEDEKSKEYSSERTAFFLTKILRGLFLLKSHSER